MIQPVGPSLEHWKMRREDYQGNDRPRIDEAIEREILDIARRWVEGDITAEEAMKQMAEKLFGSANTRWSLP
jgi:hypothetical protein